MIPLYFYTTTLAILYEVNLGFACSWIVEVEGERENERVREREAVCVNMWYNHSHFLVDWVGL